MRHIFYKKTLRSYPLLYSPIAPQRSMRAEVVCSSLRSLWGNGVDTEQHASLSLHLGVRERWLITTLLGLGLITFAIDASNTQLILPQLMTSLRVEVYQIHWALTAPGIARTVVIAATGWLIAWWGPRTLYLLCIGSMTMGSLGSLLAWDWPSL